jgi:hypothetical protein
MKFPFVGSTPESGISVPQRPTPEPALKYKVQAAWIFFATLGRYIKLGSYDGAEIVTKADAVSSSVVSVLQQ